MDFVYFCGLICKICLIEEGFFMYLIRVLFLFVMFFGGCFVSFGEDVDSVGGGLVSSFMGSYSTSHEGKLISETTGYGRHYMGYGYVELGGDFCGEGKGGRWLYAQLMWDQKFWESPIYFHGEVRSYFGSGGYDSQQYYFGGMYLFGLCNGSVSVSGMYRYCSEEGHGGQVTVFGMYDFGCVNLMHYSDLYKSHRSDVVLTVYNEVRVFYELSRRFEVGCIGILGYSFRDCLDSVSGALALKVNL